MVSLIGRSNVGKSTLMNAIIGQKIAIVSPKPQTTRHLIQGVLNEERGQMVFIDTPGFFLRAHDKLSKTMLERAHYAMKDIDVVVYIVDPTRAIGDEERRVAGLMHAITLPKLCVINKTDLPLRDRPYTPDYQEFCKDFGEIIELSALKVVHVKQLINTLFELLPEGEPLYPTDYAPRDLKNWSSEVIREKIFHTFGDELPYGIHVRIDQLEEIRKILFISATILTNTERHKGMIIGRGGKKLKEVGMSARKELEVAAQKKIMLELHVKYDDKWMERYET